MFCGHFYGDWEMDLSLQKYRAQGPVLYEVYPTGALADFCHDDRKANNH